MKCAGCDNYGSVNDLQLCGRCDSKLQRDFIRRRDWDYAVKTAFEDEKSREKIREGVVKKFGEKLEIMTN